MIYKPKTYTVESVTSGHPDKICDQISDAILDAYLKGDPHSRVAVECFGGHGKLFIGGEITSKAQVDITQVARKVYEDIGYTDKLNVTLNTVPQSIDISQGVNTGGAGDQGIMYGYATKESDNLLPEVINQVHALAKGLENLRRSDEMDWLLPDGKTQITIKNEKVDTILISCQHSDEIPVLQIKEELLEKLIKDTIPIDQNTKIFVNPTGKFTMGGFNADTGLTGRKIMVDTYGGLVLHGGGCFSGKDATKVDRSGAYMARFVAKNIVANGFANECYVSVAYAIGRSEPLMLEALDQDGISIPSNIIDQFDFRPEAIIERLNLREPIFQKTSVYGHFGKKDLSWEETINIK